MFQNHCYLETLRKERYILSPKKYILLIYILHIIVKSCNQASISTLTSSYLITLFYYYFSYYQPLLHHPSHKYSNRNDWLWMSPKRSIYIENGFDPVIFTNNFIFTNYSLLISFSISSELYTK